MTDQVQVEGRPGARPELRILRLAGPLNLVTVPGFLDVIRAEKSPAVILDLSGVTMLDSAGVGSLIQTFISFQKEKRKLALVGLSDRAKSVLELTRVAKLFPIYESAEEAESKI